MRRRIFIAGIREIHIDHPCRAIAPLSPLLGVMQQQDLAFGHLTDAVDASVSAGDEDCVDVCPARAFAAAFSARIRLNTRGT